MSAAAWARTASFWAPVGAAAALLAAAYLPTFRWMADRWTEADSYYSHGFLVPLVTGFLIWRRRIPWRERLAAARPLDWGGAALLTGGLLLHALGAWSQVFFFSGLSLLPVLMGLTALFFGGAALRETAFAWLFLAFMVPVPQVAVAELSFALKTAATHGAIALLRFAGVPVLLQGSHVRLPHATLLVGDVCSGLRSLISLLALGAVFAYLSPPPLWRRAALFLSALPIAVAVNALRIFALCWVAEVYGEEAAGGWFHGGSGVLLFLAAVAALEAVSRGLGSLGAPRTRGGAA